MLLLDPASDLHTALAGHAERARVIFVAGLPGTGKSLLIHQLVQLAHRQRRPVSLLQWDVARPAIENHAAARAYPAHRGVTHGVVRVAVGQSDARLTCRRQKRDGPLGQPLGLEQGSQHGSLPSPCSSNQHA